MAKRNLTDRTLKALKPAASGKLYDVMDSSTPGFGVRVSDTGRKTFVLLTRFPGSKNPTRRALGVYGAITLEGARARARDWLDLIRRGRDPQDEEVRQRHAEAKKRANSFAAVCEDFIKEKLPSERKGKETERDLRNNFIGPLGALSITEIVPADVIPIIKAKKAEGSLAQARNLLGTIKRVFSWAVDQQCYFDKTVTASPLAAIKPASIIGDKPVGTRTLEDDEIFALWRAARRMRYPYGPIYQLLLLTALRLNEAADASWPEIDLQEKVWVIPASRMKGRNTKARPHAVPLTPDILAVLESLPRFKRGPFVFSSNFGVKPVWMTNRVKQCLDARMLRTLRALARRRGEEPPEQLEHWTNHDIRRSVRTRLSRLKIAEEAREAVLAHVRPGIKGVYDLHEYREEKTEALTLWAARLRDIVSPPPTNVVKLAAARA